jgi:hypothetical protein
MHIRKLKILEEIQKPYYFIQQIYICAKKAIHEIF